MGETVELTLSDGTSARVLIDGAARVPDTPESLPGEVDGAPVEAVADLPAGSAPVIPIARRHAAAGVTFSQILAPLGEVLDAFHQAVSRSSDPPDEVSVQFGLKLTQGLSLGIASFGSDASIGIQATWKSPGARPSGAPSSP